MQCEKCEYVLGPFDDVCPRCGADTSKQLAESSIYGDDISAHPFPAAGHATIKQKGILYGPYTLSEINSLIKSGNLSQSDTLLADGSGWVSLTKVQGVIVPPQAAPLEYPVATTYEGSISYKDLVSDNTEKIRTNGADIGFIALGVLVFLLPVIGFVIWLILRNKNSPMTEKIGQWTYYGLIFNLTFFATMRLF